MMELSFQEISVECGFVICVVRNLSVSTEHKVIRVPKGNVRKTYSGFDHEFLTSVRMKDRFKSQK